MTATNASAAATPPKGVVLLSGGLDSTTVLAVALSQGFSPIAVTFQYGQLHQLEVDRAQRVVERCRQDLLRRPRSSRGAHDGSAHDGGAQPGSQQIEHLILKLPFDQVGGSSLLGCGEVPDEPLAGAGNTGIPSTYVPARNTIFLSWGIGIAEARGARDLFIGVNAVDYSGYPDCRPEFIACFERLANLGTREGVELQARRGEGYFRILTPLAGLDKSQIIQLGTRLGVDYAETLSCYRPDPQGRACGRCDSCGLRRRGFEHANIEDPTLYID